MDEDKTIVNRVAASGLITFDLEEYYQQGERVMLDLKDQLVEGLILKEKNFRQFIQDHNWKQYEGKFVAVTCSADAIIPMWAFMLAAIALKPYARVVEFGSLEQLEDRLFKEAMATVNWNSFKGKKVIVKGCSRYNVPPSVYVYLTTKLQPLVASLMYGEPCSTVPLFKSFSK
jgi:hypothetical protein